jgi:3-methyladenine DNA glycosylase AlkD
MAKAWLLSVCFIKYKEKTFDFLKITKIDNFTVNKTISKIKDSLRVSSIDKERVLSLKR